MFRKRFRRLLLLLLALVLAGAFITACGPAGLGDEVDTENGEVIDEDQDVFEGDGEQDVELREALINEVSVDVQQDPQEVAVTVMGDFRDGCSRLNDIEQTRQGDTFVVTVTTQRPTDQVCTQALVPFEETFTLETANALEPGAYEIVVNGVTATLQIGAAPATPATGVGATPTAEAGATATTDVGATPAPEQNVEINEALINAIDVTIGTSPQEVMVTIMGDFRDGCSTLRDIQQTREGDTFVVTVTTQRPTGQLCTEALVPFEETFTLETDETLAAGTYDLVVNGVTATFEIRG